MLMRFFMVLGFENYNVDEFLRFYFEKTIEKSNSKISKIIFSQNAATALGPLPKDRSPETIYNTTKNRLCTTSERRVMKVWSGHYNFGPNVVYYFFVYKIYNIKM